MKKKYAVVIASLFCAGAMSVGAAQVPVFEYSFPASYNGTGATITDQSSAGNNATLGTSGAPLIDDRPAGFAATQMSLGNSNGGARVDGNSPMTTTAVADNGGFVFDVWFKTADTVNSKLMSNGGYENLYTINGNLIFSVDNGTAVTFTGLTVGQWYHAVAVFDTTGNSLVSGNIAGVAHLYVDDVLIGSANKTMRNRGPDGSRGLGINMHPVNSAEANTGIVFNPSVSLGIPVVDPAPPVWDDPLNGTTGIVGVAYSDTLADKASDPNGDPITFSLIDTGTWLDVAADGALTNNRTLVVGDIGTHSFQVVADDGITGSSTGTLSIVVRDTLSPVWNENPINGGIASAGVEYIGTLDGKADDPDGGTITYSKSSGSDWLNVASDGTLSGAPASLDIGDNTFTVVADDGNDPATSATLNIRVRADLRTVSINFTQNDGNQNFAGGENIGPLGTDSANWNNTANRDSGDKQAGAMSGLTDDTGTDTGADITWIASSVSYNWDGVGSDEARLSVGYLEDGDPGVSITVSNIPYAQYRVYGLLSTRENNTGLYEARNCYVNGSLVFGGTESTTADAFGGINVNTATNGTSWTEISIGSVTGNYWVVETSGSTLVIDGLPKNAAQRGSVSGLIIENLTNVPGGPVTNLVIAGPVVGGMELSWTGEDGKSYGVETNDNLIITDGWATWKTGLVGDGGTLTVTNSAGLSQTFYRVISE